MPANFTAPSKKSGGFNYQDFMNLILGIAPKIEQQQRTSANINATQAREQSELDTAQSLKNRDMQIKSNTGLMQSMTPKYSGPSAATIYQLQNTNDYLRNILGLGPMGVVSKGTTGRFGSQSPGWDKGTSYSFDYQKSQAPT